MLDVDTRPLDLETRTPFGIARWSHSRFRNYVVTLRRTDGTLGWGEAAPNRRYGEDRASGIELLERLAPDIADLDGPAQIEGLCDALADQAEAAVLAGLNDAGTDGRSPRVTPAWPGLRAALSAAAWDLSGKQVGEPVWKMLGLDRPAVATSYTIAIAGPDEMLAQARDASAFATLKVKLGFDGDLELAARLARELPETTFRFDANEGWERERAAKALDDQLWLRERSPVPLFADEAVLTLADLEQVGELYDGVVVKLAKAGGIANAFALLSACRGRGLQILLGCMVESSLGIAAGLQLAGLADHVDLDGALLLAHDPFIGVTVEGDRLVATDEPGLGVQAAR